MNFKHLAEWIGSVLAAAAPLGFGISRVSKDRFDRYEKKYKFLSPKFEDLRDQVNSSVLTFEKTSRNQILKIEIITAQREKDILTESYHLFLAGEPFESNFLAITFSDHLPKKCRRLAAEFNSAIKHGVENLNRVMDDYRVNSNLPENLEPKEVRINFSIDHIREHQRKIQTYIKKNELSLTSPMRKRYW